LPESGKEMISSVQKINNYLLSTAQTHFRNMKNEARRFIYIIRKKNIEYFRRYREPDRYSGVNLKYFLIYKR
jgi:hypothetical protein